jgi:hypothetical protein
MEFKMYNPATQSYNKLNEFTQSVREFSLISEGADWDWNGYWVRLRNGTLVRPVFKAAQDATEEDAFFAENYRYCWNLDGTSVTRSDYDMMEFVCND